MDSFAIAAFVISIVAFVIACFQGLLEYLSSSSSRHKCNRAAIGNSESMVKWGWNFRWWHLRVSYPILNLRAEPLLEQQKSLYAESIKTIKLPDGRSSQGNQGSERTLDSLVVARKWLWKDVEDHDTTRWHHVADAYYKLLSDPASSSPSIPTQPAANPQATTLNVGNIIELQETAGGGGTAPLPTAPAPEHAAPAPEQAVPAPEPITPGRLEGGNGGNREIGAWGKFSWWKTRDEASPELIGWKTLDFRTWRTIMRWKIQHLALAQPPKARPRASWAQMLYALGIADVKALKLAYVDADNIPDSIDVPVQRVRLHELGRIALILGFSEVHINIKSREIKAAGPHATIYTTTEAGIGRTGRFEGDMFAVHRQIGVGYPKFLQNNSIMALGRICFSCDFTTSSYSVPLEKVCQALRGRMSARNFMEQREDATGSDGTIAGCMGLEAARFANIYDAIANGWNGTQQSGTQACTPSLTAEDVNAILSQAQARWQGQVGRTIPTVIAALSFADLPCTNLGFPTRIHIQPLMPWIQHLARSLWTEQRFIKSKHLHSDFLAGRLNFLRRSGQTWMTSRYRGVKNNRGWASWDYQVVKETFDNCSDDVQAEIMKKHAIVLFPMALSLLRHFDPLGWARTVGHRLSFAPNRHYSVQKMVWAQVMILDVCIHRLVQERLSRKEDGFEERGGKFLAVVCAINRSSLRGGPAGGNEPPDMRRRDRDDHVPGWLDDEWDGDLGDTEALHVRQVEDSGRAGPAAAATPTAWSIDIDLKSTNPEMQDTTGALPRMLKLRSLFYLAFLLLGPDSSDVYETMGEFAEISVV